MPHRGSRSLLSRILDRGSGGAGFGCRIRLLPRYCASGAAAKEDAISLSGTAEAAKEGEGEPTEVTAPAAVVASQPAPREPGSPRTSLGTCARAFVHGNPCALHG